MNKTTRITGCNTAKLGKYQRAMLWFAHDKKLHSLNNDPLTQRVARSLEARGLIVINEYNQFKLVSYD